MPVSLAAAEIFQPFLIFVRVGAILSLLPGFSAVFVSARVRLLLALIISLLLAPVLAERLPSPPASAAGLVLLIVGETITGVFIGSIARIMLTALHAAGTMTAYFASLANALVQDPVVDQQTATLAGFFTTLGLTAVFATDLHHLMLQGIVDGYAVFPAGRAPPVGDLAAAIGRLVADSFVLGVQLAAPFLIVGVGYQVALGLLGRLMPQLPVYFFGMPLQVGLQIWVLVLTIAGLLLLFLDRFAGALSMLPAPA